MGWGAIQTAAEVEGVAAAADWSPWIRGDRAPAPDVARRSVQQAAEDFELLASLGCSELAITLEWARLVPHQDSPDHAEIEQHRQLLQAVRDAGLEPWACLVDGTLPGWFAIDAGGFRDDTSRNLVWPRHVNWAGETFGDLVAGWIPQREPVHWAMKSQLLALAPPGNSDTTKTEEEVRGRLLAEIEAWRVLRGDVPVATMQTGRLVRAQRNPHNSEGSVKAGPHARWIEGLLWSWTALLESGELDVGDLPSRMVSDARGAFDRVIVQLRPPVEVDADGRWFPASDPPLLAGLELALGRVGNHVDVDRLSIATDLAPFRGESGPAGEHISSIQSLASSAGVGWWASSPIDGWHWENGSGVYPGIIDRNREVRAHPRE